MNIGIEAMNFYGGPAYLDVKTLFTARGLDLDRFDNLMMEKKSVGLPCEDPVTYAVNAAKPILDKLTEEEKNSIELLITSSESGLDFGKSLSTYIHDYLGLSRNCRLFETKQACYAGTASLHMAVNFVAANVSPGAKALVIATDIARAAAKETYAEPSQAVGAAALLVSNNPKVMEIDLGAAGYYSYEVMDTYRPLPDIETGDPDLSLMSYLDCLENSYKAYAEKVEGAHFQDTFDYLAFHTPFAGMVKGAHRKMMRQQLRAKADHINNDFENRVGPSLPYCVSVGNVYSATLYLALCSLIDNAEFNNNQRVGLFSYGSGCSSEFYSGIIGPQSKTELREMKIKENLDNRYELTMEEYDSIIDLNMEWIFGIQDKEVNTSEFSKVYDHYFKGKDLLVLKQVDNFHREYAWS
ncbi:MAG: hydroxymethylglutaryl-CoA synthase family protein [bacterium]|nr:hydroxymethylglutaryl-CoA synthase family protein [bacterium]